MWTQVDYLLVYAFIVTWGYLSLRANLDPSRLSHRLQLTYGLLATLLVGFLFQIFTSTLLFHLIAFAVWLSIWNKELVAFKRRQANSKP